MSLKRGIRAMKLAITCATFSEDPHRKVGACCLRHDKSVAGIGWNGCPHGCEIDWTNRDERLLRVIHSEANAMKYTKPGEVELVSVTLLPCRNCMTLIASYGIKTIYYLDEYERDDSAHILAKDFNIELIKLNQSDVN